MPLTPPPPIEIGTCLTCLRDNLAVCTSVRICAMCTRLAVGSFTLAIEAVPSEVVARQTESVHPPA